MTGMLYAITLAWHPLDVRDERDFLIYLGSFVIIGTVTAAALITAYRSTRD
ncbi:hypothetical protein [Methylocella sp. CPCC 101449]|uniref:hypothetical protein n=1 Tax=Methylocella sp. CPCC 101449 TaxID=2987531 RepID=UPI0028904FDE|nr:hypothetical protein [Methylocella sp. CPCC 101449]MDT2020644.1 hypothetical protein [Methylocella sp. CPCC 101449]